MIWLTSVLALVLLIAALVQLSIASMFWRYFSKLKLTRLSPNQDVPVAVLMCVRGCDPSLRRGLLGLLQQQHDNFQIHVVIDNRLDAAWQVAQDVKTEFDRDNRIQIHELQTRSETCGLKCSALIQGLSYLSTDTKYLLLADSDVTTHPHWIADLVGPLEADSDLGIVFGSQWFEPPAGSTWGALVRSCWNAGAIVPTIFFLNPWAGSIAMRVSDIHRGGFVDVWRTSMVDDGPLAGLMKKLGRKIQFAPSLIMVNNENCTFAYARDWVTRMLTWSRLYEPTFFLAILHAVFSNTVMIGLFASFAIAAYQQQWLAVAAATLGLLGSGLLSVAAYLMSRKVAHRSCDLSNRKLPRLSAMDGLRLLITVPLAQLVYLWGVIHAMLAKRITWRGISYEIESKNQVRMISYQPYRSNQEQPSHSI